ncbi:helix-turn-helix transcriptional regulator [Nannocystis punicea]|uniref:Helix-turn-helix transcriptional regulator n=1 Tax=Nannocystis punicea TaxID=2995304 RepID=A0ABY7H914_9BACT|nr:helix-turn-helix transcriptional regulator [Nannocystis poenicansa]WAS95756.1 helix-turn-helix transcriptional regulator [Nannocystis poenicansa]
MTAPVGLYVAARTFVYWCASAELYGFALWGRPDVADLRALTAILDVEIRPDVVAHASLVDLRRLVGVDEGAYEILVAFLGARQSTYQGVVTRQALLRPAGLPGAVVTGFYQVMQPSYPTQVYEQPEPALCWLGLAEPAALVAELDAIVAGAMDEGIVARLGRVLVPPFAGVTLEKAAGALGMSPRSLQRRLQEENTTFQDEYNAAQVRAAQAALRDTDMKLTALALEVGCASLANFSAMFRRVTGESPSDYRARHRTSERDKRR